MLRNWTGVGRVITFLALVHMLNVDNVWHETGQMMNNQKKKKSAQIWVLSQKLTWHCGETLISIQSLAFYSILASPLLAPSPQNTVKVANSKNKETSKCWKTTGSFRDPWPCFRMIYALFEQIHFQQMWWNMMRVWQYCPPFLGSERILFIPRRDEIRLFFTVCHIKPPENGQLFTVW